MFIGLAPPRGWGGVGAGQLISPIHSERVGEVPGSVLGMRNTTAPPTVALLKFSTSWGHLGMKIRLRLRSTRTVVNALE